MRASPVPTYIISGCESDMAISPMAKADSFSKMGSQVVALLFVFQIFPEAKPA